MGSLPVLLLSLSAGSLLLLLTSEARASWQFVLGWATGGAMVGGGLFYNVTMPITMRLYPTRAAAALSALTLLGALASPIFYPIAAWMAESWGWRGALRGLVGLMALCALPAVAVVRLPPVISDSKNSLGFDLREALREPAVHRALLVFALIGLANSALLLHQVPAMQAAGLSLGAAAWFAGVRGAFQIPGRLLLAPLTSRFGVPFTLGSCYVLAGTAALSLLVAQEGSTAVVLAIYFSVVGGMSMGLVAPLNGLFQAQVYGDARLGMLTGLGFTVASLAGALGAWLSGLLVDITGSYEEVMAGVVIAQAAAVVGLIWQRSSAR
jgi:predicted MFS family arabinose efflux permease